MPPLTLNQAAKACHKSKSAILEAIRSGRMSACKDEKNQWQIDPSELFRVYPPTEHLPPIQNHYQPVDLPPQNHPTTLQTLLENEKKERERERDYLLEQLADLKKDRDHWRNQATMLLTHQPEQKVEQVEPKKSLLLEKLFGRK